MESCCGTCCLCRMLPPLPTLPQRCRRELPIRWAELGTVYRYERSGTLHGLMRVRGFTQDDAHIFCLPEQVEDEIVSVLDLTEAILNRFGFDRRVSRRRGGRCPRCLRWRGGSFHRCRVTILAVLSLIRLRLFRNSGACGLSNVWPGTYSVCPPRKDPCRTRALVSRIPSCRGCFMMSGADAATTTCVPSRLSVTAGKSRRNGKEEKGAFALFLGSQYSVAAKGIYRCSAFYLVFHFLVARDPLVFPFSGWYPSR